MSSHVVDLDVSDGVGMREGRKQAMSDKENQKEKRKEWESRLYKEG